MPALWTLPPSPGLAASLPFGKVGAPGALTAMAEWVVMDEPDTSAVQIERLSETDWLLRLGSEVDAALNGRVQALARQLRQATPVGLDDIVPAYASVLLRGDATCAAHRGEGLPAAWWAALETSAADIGDVTDTLHVLPVCYGGDHGSDLQTVAADLGMAADEVVRRHCAVTYTVAMLGFAPGFAYLLGLDPALAVPRRPRPRTRVPAGSVGLAGVQTGIYPRELPGGWQLIGRTPQALAPLTDPQRPCLLAPGDRVRFEAVDAARFRTLAAEQGDA